jgi:hypothetical protein
MGSVVRRMRRRKRSLGEVRVLRRDEYQGLELDAKVELIRSLIPLGLMHVQMLLDEEVVALAGPRHAHGDGAPAATSNSPTCGRVKLLHPEGDGTSGILGSGSPAGNPCRCFLQPPALALELEEVAVMHQAVEERGDQDDVAEQLAPVIERAVRGDDRRGLLVAAHHHIGQFFASLGG